MMELKGKKLLLGGFHDHWARADMENPSLFLASLSYYHYDFMTLQDGHDLNRPILEAAAALSNRIKIYSGKEEFYGWGHVVTVGGRKPAPPSDEKDYRAVLSSLKKNCDLIFLAHPTYPGTWKELYLTGEMDKLMDEGLVDGINLINTDGFSDPGHAELIEWYRGRDRAGKHTPIAGGWDAHLLLPDRNLPAVLYGETRSPRNHIDTAGNNRTILFAEENSLEAIRDAVQGGRTVIEDLETGALVGPASLVTFLKENGYRETILGLNENRDRLELKVPRTWVAGEKAEARVSEKGSLGLPKGFADLELKSVDTESLRDFGAAPAILERDRFYLPVVFRSENTERIWAVDTEHPIRFDIYPGFEKGRAVVEVIPRKPYSGKLSLEVDGLMSFSKSFQKMEETVKVPLEKEPGLLPRHYRFRAENESGIARTKTGFLNYLSVKKFENDFSGCPEIAVDHARFVPGYSYGANRPYPGPDVFSSRLRFAWTEEALHLSVQVRDDIHHNPYEDRWLYNGDCLQLALDPLYLREETIGSIYAWNLALPKSGAKVFRFLTPTEFSRGGAASLPNDVPVGNDYLKVEK